MRPETMTQSAHARRNTALVTCLLLSAASVGVTSALGAQAAKPAQNAADPRVGLAAGWMDAKEAARNLELVGHAPKPAGWFDPAKPGDFPFANSDLAFSGNYLVQGSFHGFQIWDISNPTSPKIRTAFVCPGGQGDPSVYRNLLFISVETPDGRVDCGTQGVPD